MVSRAKLAARAAKVGQGGKPGKPSPRPRYGEDIFPSSHEPRTWTDYVGQSKAKALLRMASASAKVRGSRLPHALIATGLHGVGKSAIARVLAFETGVGLIEVQGELSGEEAMGILSNMHDGDILFIDEAHKLVDRGKDKAEWLLPLLQDGVFVTPAGPKKVPDVCVVLATTDAQLLPETILSRLPLTPVLEAYSSDQAASIAATMARNIFPSAGLAVPSPATLASISAAASETPRLIYGLLNHLRDALYAGVVAPSDDELDLTPLLDLLDLTRDGLDPLAQNMLLALMGNGGSAGAATLAAMLGEPTVPRHTEKLLMSKGYLSIQPTGRCLTEDGAERAAELAENFAG